jgi:hypothetical protein
MLYQSIQPWWTVEIDPREPMTIIITPRKFLKASSLPANRKAKQEIRGTELERENKKKERERRNNKVLG